MEAKSDASRTLLISCYELGHQPLGLAQPLAFLERAGVRAKAIDLALDPLDEAAVRAADFIGVSVPMHTALRIGLSVANRVRDWNPEAHLCFFGLYATLNEEVLFDAGVDSVLSGECEEEIVKLAREPRTFSKRTRKLVLERLDFHVPLRTALPGVSRYVHLETASGQHLPVGAVETTRGCLHLCRHCPIPPVYEGRFFAIPRNVVLEDIRRLISEGARHIDFIDPDFLNGPGHALSITRALHEEFPSVTFNFTAKVEHLLRHRKLLAELHSLGGLFVVSAVESLSDRVLTELDKGHSRADVLEALRSTRKAGLTLRPTFVAFTPWTERKDYLELLDWIAQEDLIEAVDSVQLTLRLLIPPGSLLLGRKSLESSLVGLDSEALTHRWKHLDPVMDELQSQVERRVAQGVREGRTNRELFQEVCELAENLIAPEDRATFSPRLVKPNPPRRAPRLLEAWFC